MKNIRNAVSINDVNENFFKAADVAKQNGEAIIIENNEPKYILIDMESNPYIKLTDDEKIDIVAARILKKFRHAFEELAK